MRCCSFLHSWLWSCRTLPFCLGSRIYILPTKISIFLGFGPSCHHCVDVASFLILASNSCHLGGAWVGTGLLCWPQLPVVSSFEEVRSALRSSWETSKLRDPAAGLGWEWSVPVGGGEQPAGVPWPEKEERLSCLVACNSLIPVGFVKSSLCGKALRLFAFSVVALLMGLP